MYQCIAVCVFYLLKPFFPENQIKLLWHHIVGCESVEKQQVMFRDNKTFKMSVNIYSNGDMY